MIRVRLSISDGWVGVRVEIRHPLVFNLHRRNVDSSWHLRSKIMELCKQIDTSAKEREYLKHAYEKKIQALNGEYTRLRADFDAARAQDSLSALRAQLALVSRDIRYSKLASAMESAQQVIQLQSRIIESNISGVARLPAGVLQFSITCWRRALADVEAVLLRYHSMRSTITEILELIYGLSRRLKRVQENRLRIVNRV